MKVFGLFFVLAVSSAAMAAGPSDLYYQLGTVKSEEVVSTLEETNRQIMGNCEAKTPTSPQDVGEDIGKIDVIVDQIINIGKKIWSLIEAGRPVFNVKTDVAHALPAGIQCWSDLENWKAPQSKAWRVSYENKLGDKVVEFVYRVSYIAGGQYKGVGQYITQATISPAEMYVAWRYKFNVEGSVPAVFNIGTRENPVAGMQMNIKWAVDTSMNHHEVDQQFYINGLGELQKMQSVGIEEQFIKN